jgi:DMSO reductase anchor subunit
MSPFNNPLPESPYLRLIQHRRKMKPHTYHPDYPLVFFISFSRIAAGLSLASIVMPHSFLWSAAAFACMIVATVASIAHLNVPLRFITMIRNNRSYLVWEVRLAGALTGALGMQLLPHFGYLQGFQTLLTWAGFFLSILFLVSTGWAYRFDTHPAWKTDILPIFYIASAVMVGLVLRSINYDDAQRLLPFVFMALLLTQGLLLVLYRNHLKVTSATTLEILLSGSEKWTFLAFVWSILIMPGLLTFALLFEGHTEWIFIVMAASSLAGILLERILFFRVERPVFFLSFMKNPDPAGQYWIRG